MTPQVDSRCRSCGAPIVWRRTAAGKAMPCDPEPVTIVPLLPGARASATPVVAGLDDDGQLVRGIAATAESPASVLRSVLVSHFGTCPNAARHRKGGGT